MSMVKFFYNFFGKNLFTILEKKRKRKLSDLNPHIHRCVAVRAGIYPVAPPWILVCFLLPGLLSSPRSIPRPQRRASQIFHLLHFQPRPHTSSRNLLPMAGGGGAGAGSSSGGGGGGGREGDWDCGSCGNRNYAFRSLCNRCKQPSLLVDPNTPRDSKWLPRAGDWICTGNTSPATLPFIITQP
jgi:hypothetical protein